MEVGGTLQDSVMSSYQLMHMYTALQCRHSGGFTLHITTFRTELHTLFERGHTSKNLDCIYHNGSQGLFLQYESTRMSQVT